MKTKSLIAKMLILSMALGLVGCGTVPSETESDTTAPVSSGTESRESKTETEATTAPAETPAETESPALSNGSGKLGGMGVCTHFSHGRDFKKTLEAIKAVKTTWVRDEIRWDHVETEVGKLKMPEYAKWVDEVKKAGGNTLVILCYGNPIYPKGVVTQKDYDAGGVWNTAMPTKGGNNRYFDAYISYVDFVSRELKGKVDAYEIWNEPNIRYFNAKGASAEEYAELLTEAYKVIKKNDPDALVVGCALAGTDTDFLHKVLDAGGADYMDVISIHNYYGKDKPEGKFVYEFNKLTYAIKKYSLEEKQLWITETGYAISNVDTLTQAKYTVRNAVMFEDAVHKIGLTGQLFVYELHDSNVTDEVLGGAAYESSLGLVNKDYALKPAGKGVAKYNELVADKSFVSMTEEKLGKDTTAYFAEFKNVSGDAAYVMWAVGSGAKITISGAESTVYDCTGMEMRKKITNEGLTMNLTDSPMMFEVKSGETIKYEIKGGK